MVAPGTITAKTVADLMIATVDRYAPGFKQSVLGRQIMSPLDLERTFGLIGGDIFHGALTLDQLFSARPMLGHADYRGAGGRAVHVRFGHPSRRRRHRRAGPQCSTGNPRRQWSAPVRRSDAIGPATWARQHSPALLEALLLIAHERRSLLCCRT